MLDSDIELSFRSISYFSFQFYIVVLSYIYMLENIVSIAKILRTFHGLHAIVEYKTVGCPRHALASASQLKAKYTYHGISQTTLLKWKSVTTLQAQHKAAHYPS